MKTLHSNLLPLAVFFSLSFCFTACYDDSELKQDMNELKKSVSSLENSVKQINRDIASLKMTISALESKVYVESVVKTDNGCTLVFSDGNIVQLRNGSQGKDGQTPIISASQDNGTYYWTITYGQTTNWLLDEKGQRLPVRGKDGKDGQDGQAGENGRDGLSPELCVNEDGYWCIRYDAQSEFQLLPDSQGHAICAIGQPGENGRDGDSFFQGLVEEDDCILLILADGGEIRLPKASPRLDIYFDTDAEDHACSAGEVLGIGYTLSYGDSRTVVKVVANEGWKARVEASDETHGQIVVTAPDPVCDGEVLVLVSDGGEKTVLRSLRFAAGQLQIATDFHAIASKAATLTIPVRSNLQYRCVFDDNYPWISVQQPALRSAFRDDTLRLSIQSNPGQAVRKAILRLVNTNGMTLQSIAIWQANGSLNSNEIHYTCSDADTLEIDFSDFHQQRISHLMYGNQGIICFDSKVDYIGARAFQKQKRLISLRLPSQIKSIGDYAFYGCSNLEAFIPPMKLESLGNNALGSCYSIPELILPEGFKSVGDGCCMDDRALSRIELPASTETIGNYAFTYCRKLNAVHCLAPEPPVLGNAAFDENAEKRYFHLPSELFEIYGDNLLWKRFQSWFVDDIDW